MSSEVTNSETSSDISVPSRTGIAPLFTKGFIVEIWGTNGSADPGEYRKMASK